MHGMNSLSSFTILRYYILTAELFDNDSSYIQFIKQTKEKKSINDLDIVIKIVINICKFPDKIDKIGREKEICMMKNIIQKKKKKEQYHPSYIN